MHAIYVKLYKQYNYIQLEFIRQEEILSIKN